MLKPEYINNSVKKIKTSILELPSKIKNVKKSERSYETIIQPYIDNDNLIASFEGLKYYHLFHPDMEIRKASLEAMVEIKKIENNIFNDKLLFFILKDYFENKKEKDMTESQEKYIRYLIVSFQLNGVTLPDKKKKELESVENILAKCKLDFVKNIRDDTTHFKLTEKQINGMPSKWKKNNFSEEHNKYIIKLNDDDPLIYLESPKIRYAIIKERNSVCRDENTKLLQKIIALRTQKAGILGFDNYLTYRMINSKAQDFNEVAKFLEEITVQTKKFVKQEIESIKKLSNIKDFRIWDTMYYTRKKCEKNNLKSNYNYFPIKQTIINVINIFKEILTFEIEDTRTGWHKDVMSYKINSSFLYLDIFYRKNKIADKFKCYKISDSYVDGMERKVVILANINKDHNLSLPEILEFVKELGKCMQYIYYEGNNSKLDSDNFEFDCTHVFPYLFQEYFLQKKNIKKISSINDEKVDKLFKYYNVNKWHKFSKDIMLSIFDQLIHNMPNVDVEKVYNTLYLNITQYYAITNTNESASLDKLIGDNHTNFYSEIYCKIYSKMLHKKNINIKETLKLGSSMFFFNLLKKIEVTDELDISLLFD